MIELIMVFALGACVMGLATLFVLPAFWRRALRLTRQQIAFASPLDMRELLIQTDLLRAEFAAERRRYELRLENAFDARAGLMTQAGRQIKEMEAGKTAYDRLKEAHEALILENRQLEWDGRAADGMRAAMEVEWHDCLGLNARLRDELADIQSQLAGKTKQAADRAQTIRALAFHIDALKGELTQLEKAYHGAKRLLANREETVLGLTQERRRLIRDLRNFDKRMTRTQNRLQAESARSTQLTRACEKALSETELAHQNAAQSALRFAQEIKAAQERIKMAETMTQELREDFHVHNREEADKIEILRAEIARLNGALEAARAGHAPQKELRAMLLEIAAKIGGAPRWPLERDVAPDH